MRFARGGYTVLVDYAHNPDGLHGFLTVARHLQGSRGRLALLLGAAGNRQDADIAELARVAAGFRPDLVVVKENEHHLRGRQPGEVPRILETELRRSGLAAAALPPAAPTELEGAQRALAWARPGDVIALTVHAASARSAVIALLAEPPDARLA
jgi:UDP-N-acetylmuramyl tripeptide synthase